MQAFTTERPPTILRLQPLTLPPRLTRMFKGGRIYFWLILLAFGVSASSLLYPSTPSYDPWSWLLWGREILHGTLDLTHNGSSWKPMPVMFTTVLSLFGTAAPNLWLLVARAGFILTLLMSFKVTWRVTRALIGNMPGSISGEGSSGLVSQLAAMAPLLLAASITLVGTALTHTFPGDSLLGYSEGVAVASAIIAVERAVDGHHRQAFALGIIASLDRPEAWVFWGPYGLWLMWKDPGARALVIGLGILMLLLWFVPQKLGGKSAAVTALSNHSSNSAVNSSFPFWTELKDIEWTLVLTRVKLVGIITILASAWILWRRRAKDVSWLKWRPTGMYEKALVAIVAMGVFGYAWWTVIAAETQIGFPGNPRYSIFGSIPEYICGSVGYSWAAVLLAREAGRRLKARNRTTSWEARAVAATALLTVIFLFGPNYVGNSLMTVHSIRYEQRYQARIREMVSALIQSHGGREAILKCGTVVTENHQVPMLAWYLGVHTRRVFAGTLSSPNRPINVIFQTAAGSGGPLVPTDDLIGAWIDKGFQYKITLTNPVNLYEDCRK